MRLSKTKGNAPPTDINAEDTYEKYANQGRKKALSIAIRYDDLAKRVAVAPEDPPLKLLSPYLDPPAIRKTLTKYYGYKDEDIVVLMDNGKSVVPTRINMIMAMEELVQDAGPGDQFVFHFSGHGSQVKNVDGSEVDGFDEVIWPSDVLYNPNLSDTDVDGVANYIKDDDIKRILVDPLPAGTKLTIVLDCCCSGTGADLPYSYCESESVVIVDSLVEASPTSAIPGSIESKEDIYYRMKSSKPTKKEKKKLKSGKTTGSNITGATRIKMPFIARSVMIPAVCESHGLFHGISRMEHTLVDHFSSDKSKQVTSWSACKDDQQGFDTNKGGVLTQAFARILDRCHTQEHKDPTHEKMLEWLSLEMYRLAKEARVDLAAQGMDVEGFQAPRPCLGSLARCPKVLHRPFTF